MRGARVLHPSGVGFAARLEITGAEHAEGSILSEREVHPAIVRLSRGAGLPGALPDVLGVALRLVDARGPGRHQDLLFASSAQSPGARHALLPGIRGFFDQFFSTLLPYRVDGAIRMIGLCPTNGGPSPRDLGRVAGIARGRRYLLCVAGLGDPWRTVGELEIGERLPDEVIEPMRFSPWNTGADLRPLGPLMGFRDAAYAGSQRGRLPDDEVEPPLESDATDHRSNGHRSDAKLSRVRDLVRG
jgi:hypothetical protein